ncbi:MAG: phosphoribosylaminoimidazolesuccinocarboxamide synthase [Armatimonadetes bacterium]|nr:phosphoribosylaminoimidazolesuccinocarboxamide synthase [Armatimonadota bacterium]
MRTEIPGLPRVATGKVRDVYAVGSDQILLVSSDRVSAFDVVLAQGIPGKGAVLTQISRLWFEQLADIVPNHFLAADDETVFAALEAVGVSLTPTLRETLSRRCMLCRRTKPLSIEAVVRGYLSGSAWVAYQAVPATNGVVDLWGVSVPANLRESDKLPKPIFTPSTKATAGHDEPMPQNEIAGYIGKFADPVREASLALYEAASEYARERGILLADTKFEFGVTETGELLLIDEALTPDSSRFWDAATYEPGRAQASLDKQFVRDYLLSVPGWNKEAPAPDLPADVVAKTTEKYRQAYRLLTGDPL